MERIIKMKYILTRKMIDSGRKHERSQNSRRTEEERIENRGTDITSSQTDSHSKVVREWQIS